MNMDTPADARLEVKFVSPAVHLDGVLQWVQLHRAGFISPYPGRWVNNVYFDTHDFASYEENLAGASARVKVRYRWYGEDRAPAKGVLEVKCKRNHVGWKLQYPVRRSPYQAGDTWRDVRAGIRDELPKDGYSWLAGHPLPVLINRYFRRYFATRDGGVRLTVDAKQSAWDQRFRPSPDFGRRASLPDTVVVEMKCDRERAAAASHLLRDIPVRSGRHSKYISGVWGLYGL